MTSMVVTYRTFLTSIIHTSSVENPQKKLSFTSKKTYKNFIISLCLGKNRQIFHNFFVIMQRSMWSIKFHKFFVIPTTLTKTHVFSSSICYQWKPTNFHLLHAPQQKFTTYSSFTCPSPKKICKFFIFQCH